LKNYHLKLILILALFSGLLPGTLLAQKEGVRTVVIDAGHGGHDPGNLGTRRYKETEKDIALAVALKTGEYIEEYLKDVEVIYTRNDDSFVELKERAAIANRAEADLFISIHCDAFTKSSVHGATSLVMGKNHADDNMRVAMRENSVIYLEEDYEEKYEGFDPQKMESYIALAQYQDAFKLQSVSFAQKVQDQFRERVSRRDRGVKQQPLMVTKMAVMPAVLVELGFLTNPNEEDFLRSEKGQAYMASAIYRAFRDYKNEREALEEQMHQAPLTQQTPDIADPPAEETVEALNDPVQSETIIEEPEVYYTIQLAASMNKKELEPENFNGVENVNFYKDGKLFKYIVGQTTDLEEAKILKQKMRNRGFSGAFVVAFHENERISLSEAASLLQ